MGGDNIGGVSFTEIFLDQTFAITLYSTELCGHCDLFIYMLENTLSSYFVGRSLAGALLVHLCVNMPRPVVRYLSLSGSSHSVGDVNLTFCFPDCCSIWPCTNRQYRRAAFQVLVRECDLDRVD